MFLNIYHKIAQRHGLEVEPRGVFVVVFRNRRYLGMLDTRVCKPLDVFERQLQRLKGHLTRLEYDNPYRKKVRGERFRKFLSRYTPTRPLPLP